MFSRIRTLCCDRDFQASNTTHDSSVFPETGTTHALPTTCIHSHTHTHTHPHTHTLHLVLTRGTSVLTRVKSGDRTGLTFTLSSAHVVAQIFYFCFVPVSSKCFSGTSNLTMCPPRGPKQQRPPVSLYSWNQKHGQSHVCRGEPDRRLSVLSVPRD